MSHNSSGSSASISSGRIAVQKTQEERPGEGRPADQGGHDGVRDDVAPVEFYE